MKKRIDFILENSDANERTIFRFYPRQSHVHGFDETCPQRWNEVYKVYYSWKIIQQYRFDVDSPWETYTVFEMSCDECSALGAVPATLRTLDKNAEDTLCAEGYGAEWHILHFVGNKDFKLKESFHFTLWDNFTNQGYRFVLGVEDAERFAKYIDYVQEYMLAHSEPI